MTEQKNEMDWAKSAVGLSLFFVGAMTLALVVTSMVLGTADEPGLASKAAAVVIAAVGQLPAITFSVGFLAIGGLLFLAGKDLDIARHTAGVVAASLSFSVLMGAVSIDAGGAVGSLGEMLTQKSTLALGAVVGICLVVGVVWATWLKPAARISQNSGQTQPVPAASSQTNEEPDGVTQAEAAGLVPDQQTVAYMEGVWRHAAEHPRQTDLPPSPYPEDVRSTGGVPAGATPIKTHAAPVSTPSPNVAAAPQGRAAEDVAAGVAARADLVAKVEASAAGVVEAPVPPPAQVEPVSEVAPPPIAPAPVADAGIEVPPPAVDKTAQAFEPEEGPPRPSWEQSDLFVGEATAEDEVEEEELVAEAAEPEDAEEEEYEEEEEAEYEEGEEEEEEEEEEDPEAEYEEGEEEEEEEGEEEEEEEEEEEAAEYEEGEEEEEEEEEAAEYEEGEEEEEEEEEGEEEEYEEEEEEDSEAEYEEEEDEEEEEEEVAEEEEEAPTASAPEAPPEPTPAPEPAAPEREITLEPRPVAPPAPKTSKRPSDPEALIYESGLLFVQEGRVAVSLLQRSFGLDFDEACGVLDELQERGLIGAYLGGQRRDILMTLEDWKAAQVTS